MHRDSGRRTLLKGQIGGGGTRGPCPEHSSHQAQPAYPDSTAYHEPPHCAGNPSYSSKHDEDEMNVFAGFKERALNGDCLVCCGGHIAGGGLLSGEWSSLLGSLMRLGLTLG